MSESTFTLAELLPRHLSVDSSQMHLDGTPKNIEPAFLEGVIQYGVTSALNVDVLELIAEAWAQTNALRTAAAAKDGQPTHVFLAKHDVACDNQLKVVLQFTGAAPVTDHLDLQLKASFEGVGVIIENRCIMAMDAGHGKATAELHYSNARLLGQSNDWVALPVKFRFAHPIQIGRGGAASEVEI
jgi:hypothetical protein